MTSGSVAPAVRGHTVATGDPHSPETWVRTFLDAQEEARRALLLALHTFPESEVESHLTALKEESLRFLYVDPHKAEVLADALIAAAGAVGRRDHHALGLMAKGDALRAVGHYAESLTLLDEAAASFLAQQNELGWARTRIGWLISAHRLGHGEEALAVVDRARDVLVRHQEWLRAGGLDLNTAVVCKDLGLYERSLELYERARAA